MFAVENVDISLNILVIDTYTGFSLDHRMNMGQNGSPFVRFTNFSTLIIFFSTYKLNLNY